MFKVGDKVRRVKSKHYNMVVGDEATVTEVREDLGIKLDRFGADSNIDIWHADYNFELVPAGPVRTETVTTRRIVPGVYGRLRVGEKGEVGDYNKPEITVEIAIQPWRPGYEPHFYDLNAEELDSLAMVASQLAEALRDLG